MQHPHNPSVDVSPNFGVIDNETWQAQQAEAKLRAEADQRALDDAPPRDDTAAIQGFSDMQSRNRVDNEAHTIGQALEQACQRMETLRALQPEKVAELVTRFAPHFATKKGR